MELIESKRVVKRRLKRQRWIECERVELIKSKRVELMEYEGRKLRGWRDGVD